MAITNRPIAGTLMGALALGGLGATKIILPDQYYISDPGISATPAEKASLGITPVNGQLDPTLAGFGGPGCYVMQVPANVRGMRFKLWGGSGHFSGGSPWVYDPGYIQADLKVAPLELLFVIIGIDGQSNYDGQILKNTPRMFGGPGMYYPADPTQPPYRMGGGFTAVFRLTSELIQTYNIAAPTGGAMFSRYLFNANVMAITDAAKLLILSGGSGGGGNDATAAGKGGYPAGNTEAAAPIGKPGSQTAGGVPGTGTIIPNATFAAGTKFQGGGTSSASAGAGGGGYFGGGPGNYTGSSTNTYYGGGGGSSFIDLDLCFNPYFISSGMPAGDPDAPVAFNPNLSGMRRQGKLVVQWDTPT